MWWNEGTGLGGWGWVVMTLTMLVLWGLFVVGVVALVRAVAFDGPTRVAGPREPAKILDERFARGEMDAEEYRARKDVLRGSR